MTSLHKLVFRGHRRGFGESDSTATMPPTLAYWDIRGLGQAIRLLLNYVGEEFEDKKYSCGPAPDFSMDDWFSVKFTLGLDFPNLPYYIDGDMKITQSKAILRHIGRKYDMVGSTEAERITVDMMCDQVFDFHWALGSVCYGDDFEEKREGYLERLPASLKLFEDFFGDKPYSAGAKLTFPDFHFYEILDTIKFLQPSCLDNFPKLQAFVQRFETLPAIKRYMESDKFIKLPIFNKMAKFGNKLPG